jgi:hypothetical protein
MRRKATKVSATITSIGRKMLAGLTEFGMTLTPVPGGCAAKLVIIRA